MKVAIDKNVINKIKDFNEFEYIYIFEDEPIKDLLKLKLHCIKSNYLNDLDADINLTNYKIECLKKANIEDKEWYILPPKPNYKFAIIIPNYNNDHGEYNGKTYFQNCIESVLKQTYKNYELIIVDDMSTDTSVETVGKYRSQEKYIDKIHLIQNKRKRYNGGSRNVGIEYALDNLDFDYFCFLDSDDWWKNEYVLENINKKLNNHDMLIYGAEMLYNNGVSHEQSNDFDTYKDVFLCLNKVWCTAWSRVVKKNKIVYFCEDTLMEDRVWSYKQADNCDFDKIIHLNKICYVWNRKNTTNSVSLSNSNYWKASAWCHIGHQIQFLGQLKHQEMKNTLQERIKTCIEKHFV